MSARTIAMLLAAACYASATVNAQAGNAINVLQFGGANASSISQVGTTLNTASALQFGADNQAATTQVGAISPLTINNSVIGQGGGIGFAMVGQSGGANTSFIGQIGSSNTAGIAQFGLLNGSQIVQQSQ